jgi:hypothetical protein
MKDFNVSLTSPTVRLGSSLNERALLMRLLTPPSPKCASRRPLGVGLLRCT